jgi:hypothetical protein
MLAEYKPSGQEIGIPIAFAVWNVENIQKLQDISFLRRTPGLYMIYTLPSVG